MRIGLLSDIHMRSSDADAVRAGLDDVVGHFNGAFRPDRVVVLGDLIEDEGPERDRAHVAAVVRALEALDAPVTYLRGNHDVEALDPGGLDDLLGGPAWGRIDGTDLLFLDSSAPRLPGAPGHVDPDQLAFLDDALSGLDAALVFVHHPVHHHPVVDNVWFADAPERAFCVNKRDVHRVLERHGNVRAVFNGHLHEWDHTRYRGIDHFTVNAFNKETPDAPVSGTYAEVTVDDRVSVTVVEGDRIRRTVTVPGLPG